MDSSKEKYQFKILPPIPQTTYLVGPPDLPEGKLVTFPKEVYDLIMGIGDDWMYVQDLLKKAYEDEK